MRKSIFVFICFILVHENFSQDENVLFPFYYHLQFNGKINGTVQNEFFIYLGIKATPGDSGYVPGTGPVPGLFDVRFVPNNLTYVVRGITDPLNYIGIQEHRIRVLAPASYDTIDLHYNIPDFICIEIRDVATGNLLITIRDAGIWQVPQPFTQKDLDLKVIYNIRPIQASTLWSPLNDACLFNPVLLEWYYTGTLYIQDCYPVIRRLQLATDVNFTNLIKNDPNAVSPYLITSDLAPGTYYWRVISYRTRGLTIHDTAISAVRRFTIANSSNFGLLTPLNGAICVELKPTFTWNAVAGCTPSAIKYQIQVFQSTNTTPVINIANLTTTTYMSTTSLLQNTLYRWTVTASAQGGIPVSTSEFTFLTGGVPAKVLLTTPVNNATGVTLTPTLDWQSLVGCTPVTYNIVISKQPDLSSPIVSQLGLTADQFTVAANLLTLNTEYYWQVTALNNFGLGIPSDVWSFSTAKNLSDISIISPNGEEVWRTGSQKNIQWTYSYINDVKIEYSTDSGVNWLSIKSSTPAIDGQFTWTVSGNQSNNCFIRISDASDQSVNDMNKTAFTIFEYPGSVSLIKTFFFGDISDKSNYKIIGLPGNINIPVRWTTQGSHKYDWNVFWDDGSNSNYQIEYTESDLFKFRPGRAFWLLSRYAVAVSTEVNSVLIDESFLYSIPLHSGWNLISNPFDKTVLWSAVQSKNPGIQPIHRFNKTYSISSNFEPYTGYYFNNATNLASLSIPYPVTGTVPTIVNKNNNEESAYIKMWITGTEGEKTSVEIRNDLNGVRGFDTGDIFAPPGDFEKLKISIRNNEIENPYKYLMRDNRNLEREEEIEVIIKNMTNNMVRLMTELPEKLIHEKVYLVEKTKGKFTDLLSEERVFVSPKNPGSDFVLLMGSESFIESKKNEYLPKDFMLYQNYPNPFNPTTVISYGLRVPGRVTLKLFDILGNEIAVLFDMEQEGGFYEYKLSTQNLKLSSGVYFYQLRAGGLVSTKKLILMK